MEGVIKNKRKLCFFAAVIAFAIGMANLTYDVDNNLNVETSLNLESAYGDTQATHPRVINFEEPWNGYTYWMAYSPYPYADDSKENPHILASNDLYNWEEPKGFQNPLDDTPNDYIGGVCYNSDPCLCYNSDLDCIECWWRYVDDAIDEVILYRCYSTDGVHWSGKEQVLISVRSQQDYVCPIVLYENHCWKMWSVGSGYRIQYCESYDLKNWSDIQLSEIPYSDENLRTWHIDILHTEKGYECIVVAFDSTIEKNSHQQMSLYYTYSKNNKDYETAILILSPTTNTEKWDNWGIYKSAMIYENGQYIIFYSAIKKDETRGVGITFWEGL